MNTISAEEIAQFVVLHNPPMRKWMRHDLVYWIGWACEQGFCIPISNDGLQLHGVVIAKPVMAIDEMRDHYAFDPEGKWVYVELAIATHPIILRCIAIALLKRFGMREAVFWHRRRNPAFLHGRQAQRVLQKILTEKVT